MQKFTTTDHSFFGHIGVISFQPEGKKVAAVVLFPELGLMTEFSWTDIQGAHMMAQFTGKDVTELLTVQSLSAVKDFDNPAVFTVLKPIDFSVFGGAPIGVLNVAGGPAVGGKTYHYNPETADAALNTLTSTLVGPGTEHIDGNEAGTRVEQYLSARYGVTIGKVEEGGSVGYADEAPAEHLFQVGAHTIH